MALGGSSKDSGVGAASRAPYYSGRSADSYLRGRRSGPWKAVGLVVAGLLVLGAVGVAGFVLGRRSVESDTTASSGTTSTVASTVTAVAPVTTPPNPLVTTRPNTYIVQAGDSLGKIAKQFDTTIAALVLLNGIANPDRLIEGTTLKIPPPNPPTTPAPSPPPS